MSKLFVLGFRSSDFDARKKEGVCVCVCVEERVEEGRVSDEGNEQWRRMKIARKGAALRRVLFVGWNYVCTVGL
jgi:hypothetical protein